jgi:hypothetical protein
MSDPDTTGPGDDLGADDPVTGVPAARTDLDDTGTDEQDDAQDPLEIRARSMTTVTNDAVAGETVLPGPGDGNDGPTGGSPAELQPILPDNELDGGDIHLDDERAGPLGSGADAG